MDNAASRLANWVVCLYLRPGASMANGGVRDARFVARSSGMDALFCSSPIPFSLLSAAVKTVIMTVTISADFEALRASSV